MRISDWSSDVCSSDLRKVGKQTAFLEHVAEAPTLRRQADATLRIEQRLYAQHDAAARRAQQACQHIHQRGLAGARAPEQRGDAGRLAGEAGLQALPLEALGAVEFTQYHCPRQTA